MNIFPFTKEIAIDLGTANTIIITDDKIAVEEPSVVAIRKSDDRMMAVGRKASAMIGRGEDRIHTVRPLKKGVIADYKACEMMIRGLIDLTPQRRHLFRPSVKMVVCVPSGATDAEMRIINDSCVHKTENYEFWGLNVYDCQKKYKFAYAIMKKRKKENDAE